MCRLTITPISGDNKKKSNIDYKEILDTLNWMWDDSQYNSTCPGDLFAFLFTKHKNRPLNEQKLVFHEVKTVKDPSHRLPSWSSNVGQTNRQVLNLSPPLFEISLNEWIQNGGHGECRGTYHPKKIPLYLIDRYNKYLREIEWKMIDNNNKSVQLDNFDWGRFDQTGEI
jgi:hypothetical protein